MANSVPFDKAVALHRRGDLEGAEAAYLAVLDQAPEHAGALGNLAIIRRRQGRQEEAVALHRRAIEQEPDAPDRHCNLGNALNDLGRYPEAAEAYKAAIARHPDSLPARLSLGELYRKFRQIDSAREQFEAAARAHPESGLAHMNLGNIAFEASDADAAERHFRKALTLEPNLAVAHQNLATLLKARGAMDEARQHYEQALQLDGNLIQAHYNFAQLRKFEADDPEFERLHTLLDDPARTVGERASLHFALGKMYADTGDPDRAFAHYRAGNDARTEGSAQMGRHFDPDGFSRSVDRILATFTEDFFAQRPATQWGHADDRPVLIVGMPRSGTTLVEQILASHPAIHGAGELSAIAQLLGRVPEHNGSGRPMPEGAADLDPDGVRRLADAYRQQLPAVQDGVRRITDKMPENFLRLGLFALLFPHGRIIHCRRDPLDTCLSCFCHHFTEEHEYTNDLTTLGRFYRDYERLMAHWRSVLPIPMHEVRYEELIADQEGQSRALVDFLGLPWDPACLAFHRHDREVRTASNAQVRQPLYRSAMGRWRPYAAHLGPLFETLGIDPDTHDPQSA